MTRICAVAGFFVSIPVFLTGSSFFEPVSASGERASKVLEFVLTGLSDFPRRYCAVHGAPVPVDAGHYDEHSDQCGNRLVRMRNAAQHRRLA